MKYLIESTRTIYKNKNVEAETRQEAVVLFRQKNPLYTVDAVEGEEPLGYCEVTGAPIFEGDDYQQDSEGIMWLVKE